MSFAAVPPDYVIAAGAIWPVVGSVLVGLRFYARRALGTQIGYDDWMTIPALVGYLPPQLEKMHADGIASSFFLQAWERA